jgi:RecA/RadA recombinase
MAFKRADKKQSFLRMALMGPAGSGKSYTALTLAKALAQGGQVAAIDTERGSLAKYADKFDFDVEDQWPDYAVRRYIEAIQGAEKAGYKVLVIDSLSHAWAGVGGILEFVDNKKGNSNNSFSAWRDATPMHNQLVDAILTARMHVIVTMRTKTDYVQEKDEKGRTVIRKMGLQPVQRDGLEYEFDIIADMDGATMTVSKTRCDTLFNRTIRSPGPALGAELVAWLEGGAPIAEVKPAMPDTTQEAPPALPEQHDGAGQVNEIKTDCAAAIGRIGKERSREVSAIIGRYCVRTDKGIQSIPSDPDTYRALRAELAGLS